MASTSKGTGGGNGDKRKFEDGPSSAVALRQLSTQKKKVFPQLDDYYYTEVKEGVLTRVNFAQGRRHFVPRDAKHPHHDSFFPPEAQSLEINPPWPKALKRMKLSTPLEYTWKEAREIHRKARFLNVPLGVVGDSDDEDDEADKDGEDDDEEEHQENDDDEEEVEEEDDEDEEEAEKDSSDDDDEEEVVADHEDEEDSDDEEEEVGDSDDEDEEAESRPGYETIQQGLGQDCWFGIACYLVQRFRPDLLHWLVVPDQCNELFHTLRLRLHNSWVQFPQDHMFAMEDLRLKGNELLEIEQILQLLGQNTNRLFGFSQGDGHFEVACLEKGLASFHGSYNRMCGGMGAEGVSYIADSVGLEYTPKKLGYRRLAKVLHAAMDVLQPLEARGVVAFCSDTTKTTPPRFKSKLMSEHAFGAAKFMVGTFMKKPITLVAVKNPHGEKVYGPIHPKAPFFELFNKRLREMIRTALQEDGVIILPLSVVMERFHTVEVVYFLPPVPANLNNEFSQRQPWKDYSYRVLRREGVWKNGCGADVYFPTPKKASKNFIILSQFNRLGKIVGRYMDLSMEVYDVYKDEEKKKKVKVAAVSVEGRYQAAVTFYSKNEMMCKVTLRNATITSVGMYQLLIYCIEGYPAEPVLPEKHCSEAGTKQLVKMIPKREKALAAEVEEREVPNLDCLIHKAIIDSFFD